MGKSMRDWRHGARPDKTEARERAEKNCNRDRDWEPPKLRGREEAPARIDRNRDHGDLRGRREKVKPDPLAQILVDTIRDQIQAFLACPVEERYEASADLFNLGSYPADLDGIPGAERYRAWQLDRNVRVFQDKPEDLRRLSTTILLQDRESGYPAYYLTAFITPTLDCNVRVVPMDERGQNPSKLAFWDSRSGN